MEIEARQSSIRCQFSVNVLQMLIGSWKCDGCLLPENSSFFSSFAYHRLANAFFTNEQGWLGKTACGTYNYRSETSIYCLIHGVVVRIRNFVKFVLTSVLNC